MKDLKISNTLLNEILKRPVKIVSIDEYECMIRNSTYFDNEQMGIVYRYLYGNNEVRFMSIYEFAFLCKEWALTKGYKIQSQINYENKGHSHISKISENEWAKGFFKDTEIEAIIQACEWILKEIQE